ncbi:hypothetical protein [Agrobacterium tumefaciens]|uniref:hypothetical protein n=1 Tax=Agrobacterium tumefaciens TaxID=358 RepID=UPI0021CF956D|nr:hypothetical protein [Agrobacterium tumefaciens]UXS01142.1 hypothetical protein FY156_06365 [Agrobacterium tumefaciens]
MSYSLLSRKLTKARIPHRCIWCCHEVLVGSLYVRECSTYDGHFQNFAWHEACRKDADDYFDDGGCENFTSGNDMPFYALYELEKAA